MIDGTETFRFAQPRRLLLHPRFVVLVLVGISRRAGFILLIRQILLFAVVVFILIALVENFIHDSRLP